MSSKPSLDADRLVLELRVGVQHVEPLLRVLLSQRNASALQGLAATVTRPCPRQIPPRLERRRMNDRRRFRRP